jgi:hypothetical protein
MAYSLQGTKSLMQIMDTIISAAAGGQRAQTG